MQSTERWLPIPGYEGYYEVSDHGNVRSVDRIRPMGKHARFHRGRVLKPGRSGKSGHLSVVISNGVTAGSRLVHALVLEAFVGVRPDGYEACHDDGDGSNNALSNLRWDSRAENTRDRVRHGTHQMTNRTHCPHGHEYAPWNLCQATLRQGRRRCLACKRAQSWSTDHRVPFSPALADEYYARILEDVA